MRAAFALVGSGAARARREATAILVAWEKTAREGRKNVLTESRMRRTMSDILEQFTGSSFSCPSVAEYFHDWVESKKEEKAQPNGGVEISAKQADGIDMVLQWVRDGLTSCSEIAEEMGLSKGAVSKMATKLAELGRLKTNGRQYALP